MSDQFECPSCRWQSDSPATRSAYRPAARCPRCGSRLIAAAGPKEAEVRKHLYGHRIAPIRVANPRGHVR